jgi:hypothetical protein
MMVMEKTPVDIGIKKQVCTKKRKQRDVVWMMMLR